MDLSNHRILVTGGSGFIGTNLILALERAGGQVVNVDIRAPQVDVKTIKADLRQTDYAFLEGGFDYVIHLAALSNARLCQAMGHAFDNNVAATLKLMEKLSALGRVRKIIFMSSVVLYADGVPVPIPEDAPLYIGHNNYTLTKALGEQICEFYRIKHQLPILTFRLPNIYGPYQDHKKFPNLLPQIAVQALREGRIEIWSRKPVRDWIYVEDAVRAIMLALKGGYDGVMNLGTGIGTSVGDVVDIVAALTNCEVVCLNKTTTGPSRVICDISRIRTELGWEPRVTIEEGVQETIRYFQYVVTRGG